MSQQKAAAVYNMTSYKMRLKRGEKGLFVKKKYRERISRRNVTEAIAMCTSQRVDLNKR